jgi:hypothetical protein
LYDNKDHHTNCDACCQSGDIDDRVIPVADQGP